MGQAKQRGSFNQRKAIAEEAQRRIEKLPPYGSLLLAPSDVRQAFLDIHGPAQKQACIDKRHQDEFAIFLKVLLAFSAPLNTTAELKKYRILENFKSKTGGMTWWFYGDFLDITAVTVFDSDKVPHVFLNDERHRDDGRIDGYEFFDSLIHEMTHATGPTLGRWDYDQQPILSTLDGSNVMPYAIEEFIAITTASTLIGEIFSIPNEKSKAICSESIANVIERLKLSSDQVETVDWGHVEHASQQVTTFLCSE